MEPAFYTEKDIARRLSMSASWVRQQRFRKAHGLPNSFDLEPCFIGGGVRYVATEVEAFIEAKKQGRL